MLPAPVAKKRTDANAAVASPIERNILPNGGLRFAKPSLLLRFCRFAGQALSTVLLCDSASNGKYKNSRCDSHPKWHQRDNHKWREKL